MTFIIKAGIIVISITIVISTSVFIRASTISDICMVTIIMRMIMIMC